MDAVDGHVGFQSEEDGSEIFEEQRCYCYDGDEDLEEHAFVRESVYFYMILLMIYLSLFYLLSFYLSLSLSLSRCFYLECYLDWELRC